MNDKLRQSDTYHGIAHNLGSWVGRLETGVDLFVTYKTMPYKHIILLS
jgi:hypothetical protein